MLPTMAAPSPSPHGAAAVPSDGVELALTLLTLLAEDATPAELAAASPDAAITELALSLRSTAHLSRRREQGLDALVHVATDLASMRDPSGVLGTIVRRTRTLLGADVAYLTLADPERGDTYMRATAGSIAAAFQSLRLDLGDGLGGLVASTHKPYWTSDYRADDRFHHTGSIDGAVGEEGIVGICGTPLIVKGDFVGVLFAAHRRPHAFTHDEVSLIGSLAALAAVSIVQVRARDETARALAALSSAHDLVRRQAAGVERAAAAHDRFADLVLSGGGVDDITTSLTGLLGGWAVLLDERGEVRSRSGEAPEHLAATGTALTVGDSSRLQRRGDTWAVSVSALEQPLGTLVVGEVGDLDEPDRRTVERAAVVTALVLLIERNRAEALQQRRTDLVADLVLGRGDSESRLRAARTVGVDVEGELGVAVVRSAQDLSRQSLMMSVSSAVGPDALVGELAGDVVVVRSGISAADLARQLADRLRRVGGATVGAASAAQGHQDLPAAHAEARRAVEALTALGRHGEGAALADLGFAGLVVGSQPDIAAYTSDVLAPLAGYDDARGTDLVTTLEAWFGAGRSPRAAAEVLHVHPNTVGQRLDRIGALLGEGWQEPDRSLELQLALHLRHLVPSTPVRAPSTASATAVRPGSRRRMS